MIVMFRHTASIIRALAGQSAPPVAVYSAMRRQQSRMCIRRRAVLGGHARYRGTASASTLSRISWMNVSSFYEVHIDPQQIMETREKSATIAQTPAALQE